MKNKNFNYYVIIWLVAVIVFNFIVFVIPNEVMGIKRFDNTLFWVSYVLMVLTFIGQLLVTLYVLKKATTNEKLFYRIPIMRMSFVVLISSIILGLIFMIITKIPTWIGIIVCAIALLIYVVYCVSAFYTSNKVEQVNTNTKSNINCFKNMTTEAENLIAYAKNETAKSESKKVYELFRYSDYVSNPELQKLEKEISQTFELFSKAVTENNNQDIVLYSNKLTLLLNERDKKVKLTK